ncbi:UbiA prenyltransferase family protein [Patescibacteria group bacterium]|nr:UbiA prenyltransferase family protein [Patescibacteria group bacterium]
MSRILIKLKYILLSLRPKQWIKNLLVYSFLFFDKELFNLHDFIVVTETFFVLILLSSSVYLINDLIDLKRDKVHPVKRMRALASGKITQRESIITSLILFCVGFILTLFISEYLSVIYIFYYILMIFYSMYLKNIIIIDALTTATGFVLRAIAGGVVIANPINSWLIIFIICGSLFVAFAKRRAEVVNLSFKNAIIHREVLRSYPKELLDNLISLTGAVTFFSYILFSYNEDLNIKTPVVLSHLLPIYLKNPHWVKFSIPLVFYIIARYIYDIYVKKEGGEPENIIYEDKALMISGAIYIALLFTVLYII